MKSDSAFTLSESFVGAAPFHEKQFRNTQQVSFLDKALLALGVVAMIGGFVLWN
jgi:hypothetical protein